VTINDSFATRQTAFYGGPGRRRGAEWLLRRPLGASPATSSSASASPRQTRRYRRQLFPPRVHSRAAGRVTTAVGGLPSRSPAISAITRRNRLSGFVPEVGLKLNLSTDQQRQPLPRRRLFCTGASVPACRRPDRPGTWDVNTRFPFLRRRPESQTGNARVVPVPDLQLTGRTGVERGASCSVIDAKSR